MHVAGLADLERWCSAVRTVGHVDGDAQLVGIAVIALVVAVGNRVDDHVEVRGVVGEHHAVDHGRADLQAAPLTSESGAPLICTVTVTGTPAAAPVMLKVIWPPANTGAPLMVPPTICEVEQAVVLHIPAGRHVAQHDLGDLVAGARHRGQRPAARRCLPARSPPVSGLTMAEVSTVASPRLMVSVAVSVSPSLSFSV